MKSFLNKLRNYYQIFQSKILALKPFISLSDYILRLPRYMGAGIGFATSAMQKMMAGISEGFDLLAILVDSIQFFFNEKKRNLQIFFNTIFIPAIYSVISLLSTTGVYGFKLVAHAIAMGGTHIAEAAGGLFGMGARTMIQTVSRLVSFIRLVTVDNESHLSQQEKRQVEEDIYEKMEPMSAVLISAFLVVGGIGIATGGAVYLAIAGIAIGLLVANRIYKFLNSDFVHTHFPKIYDAVQTAKAWVRRHEPLFVKKAAASVRAGYHAVREWLFPKKDLPIISNKVDIVEQIKPENKKWRWGMIESNLAEARITQPRSAKKIVEDIKLLETHCYEADDLNVLKKLRRVLYCTDHNIKDYDVLSEIKNRPDYSEAKEESLYKQACSKIMEKEIVDKHKKSFSSLTFGIGPVTALYEETKALVSEDIDARINKYTKNMVDDLDYYKENIKNEGFFAPQKYDYFFKNKNIKLIAMSYLKNKNNKTNQYVNLSEKEWKERLTKIKAKLIRIDPDFKTSFSENGERAKIFKAIVNKIERQREKVSEPVEKNKKLVLYK